MIFGGLLGWFGGAGKHSFAIGLVLAIALPFLLIWVVFFALNPMGSMMVHGVGTPYTGGEGFNGYIAGLCVGSIAATLLLFVPMAKARTAYRQLKAMLENTK